MAQTLAAITYTRTATGVVVSTMPMPIQAMEIVRDTLHAGELNHCRHSAKRIMGLIARPIKFKSKQVA